MLTLTPNKDLSNTAFLSDAQKNHLHEYPRVTREERTLLVAVCEFWFDWGPLKTTPEKTPRDVDKEVSAELLKKGLYHHKDHVCVVFTGTQEVSVYRYHSKITLVANPQKIRPPS